MKVGYVIRIAESYHDDPRIFPIGNFCFLGCGMSLYPSTLGNSNNFNEATIFADAEKALEWVKRCKEHVARYEVVEVHLGKVIGP